MVERIEQVLRNFAKNPGTQGRLLREMLEEDPKQFSSCALRSLQKGEDTRGHRYLITLLVQNGFLVEDLYNPAVFSKELAIALARQIAQVQPHFDSGLARLLSARGDGSSAVAGKVAERVLDLLEATSSGTRIVPLINHLTQHADMRLRSRAVLLIGQRLQDARATEGLMKEADPRVRANAVEALWGADSGASRALLWRALTDPVNRVMGNAIYGLYCLRDQTVIPHLLKMAADSRPLHRATAAWVMGRTSDPRFLRPLEHMSADLYAVARSNAAFAISRIKEAEENAVRLPGLDLRVLRAEKLSNGSRNLWIRVQEPAGAFVSGLAATEVILLEDGELVLDYEISETRSAGSMGIGFALCADAGLSSTWVDAAEQAVASCLPYRRSDDLWAVSKLTAQSLADIENDQTVEPGRYHGDEQAIKQAIGAAAIRTGSRPAALQAARMLLPGAADVPGRRHLILLAGQELAGAPDVGAAMHSAIANKVAIHAVMAGQPRAELEILCRQTGGTAVAAPAPEDLNEAYKRIYLGLIDRYEIGYRPPASSESSGPASLGLRVFCSKGSGQCRAAAY